MIQKKKIIIVGPAYPYRGGPSTYVSYLYKALSDDFEVKILNYKLLYPDILFPGKTQYDKSKEKKFAVPSERIVNSINPANWISTANKINEFNPDLLVIDWWHPFFAFCHFGITSFLKKSIRKRTLFITENFISHEENFIDNVLTKIGLRNAAAFLALSGIVVNDLKQISGKRKVYRSELPSFDLFTGKTNYNNTKIKKELGFEPDDKILLFFGYVRKYKGLDILLKALPSIIETEPRVKLLVAGEFYDDETKYRNIIKETAIDANVKLLNRFIPNEEVGKYYSISELVMLPYMSATQSAVLNVAYSFKKPVLVTNVGGLSEFIEEDKTGLMVKPNSPDALAEGVKKYFKIKETTDFPANITEFVSRSRFGELPKLFNEIIDELSTL